MADFQKIAAINQHLLSLKKHGTLPIKRWSQGPQPLNLGGPSDLLFPTEWDKCYILGIPYPGLLRASEAPTSSFIEVRDYLRSLTIMTPSCCEKAQSSLVGRPSGRERRNQPTARDPIYITQCLEPSQTAHELWSHIAETTDTVEWRQVVATVFYMNF